MTYFNCTVAFQNTDIIEIQNTDIIQVKYVYSIFSPSFNYRNSLFSSREISLCFSFSEVTDVFWNHSVTRTSFLGSMFILLSLNITMNRVGGASVIAKFQS